MSFLSWFSPAAVEADVVKVAIAVKNGVSVIEADLAKASKFLVASAPALEAGVAELVWIANQIGATSNPSIALAAAAMTAASKALDAYAVASNSGASSAQLLVTAYTASKTAAAAVATAKASLLSPAPAKAA